MFLRKTQQPSNFADNQTHDAKTITAIDTYNVTAYDEIYI